MTVSTASDLCALSSNTLIAVTCPWGTSQCVTVANLITDLRGAMIFADHAIAQVRAWDGSAPLTISVGGEYDITATLI